jgi:hypothetical protein
MLVRRIASAIYRLPLLVQRELLVDRVAVALNVAVQVRDVECDDRALRVVPRAVADAVARVDGGLTGGRCRAQIRVPGATARTRRTSQCLAMFVGAGESAEVGPAALTDTGHEEAHGLLRLLRLGGVSLSRGGGRREDREGGEGAQAHWGSFLSFRAKRGSGVSRG